MRFHWFLSTRNMDNIEVVCVEVEENEAGEIVCVEKMDEGADTLGDYCIMECEIASMEDHAGLDDDVEVIVFPDDPVTDLDEFCVEAVQDNSNLRTCVTSNCSEITSIPDKSSDSGNNEDVVLKVTGENFFRKVTGDKNFVKGGRRALKRNIKDLNEQPIITFGNINGKEVCYDKSITNGKREKNSISVNVDGSPGTLSSRKTYRGAVPKKSDIADNSHRVCLSELPFRCKICDKSFWQDSSLKIHLKVHAGKYSDNCRLS